MTIRNLDVTKIAYQGASEKVKKSLEHILNTHLKKVNMDLSLDRFVAMLQVVKKKQREEHKLNNEVPQIIFSSQPSVLVEIEGIPVYRDLGGNIAQVANSRFLIAQDKNNQKYYLQCAGRWFAAEQISGPWTIAGKVPGKVSALTNKNDLLSGKGALDKVPKVFVSTKPTVLVQSEGTPEMVKIYNTDLSYIKNSENDFFRDDKNMKFYVLASGRWFSADSKTGPWIFVPSNKLPDDFREIPASSFKAHVLAAVAGTQEANDAVLESYIPHTSVMNRGKVKLNIIYDGEPEFKTISGTILLVGSFTTLSMAGVQHLLDPLVLPKRFLIML